MDWFTWLSNSGLDPSLVYEYGLAFASNELEEDDIVYFNHEFLQSMGISIAKHRLEILKLARVEHQTTHVLKHPMAKLVFLLKKTKKSLTNYIASLVHRRDDDRSLILAPNGKNKKISKGGVISYSSRWKRSMMMRNNGKLVTVANRNNNDDYNQERLMFTIGDCLDDDPLVVSPPRIDSLSSPLMYDLQHTKVDNVPDYTVNDDDDDDQEDADQYWCPVVEEIRWDAMFQDLKPT